MSAIINVDGHGAPSRPRSGLLRAFVFIANDGSPTAPPLFFPDATA
jgi:hypothetical protein